MPKQQRRAFGSVRKLPSGRFQARYTGPDGIMRTARRADGGPMTFDTKGDAHAWLSMRQVEKLRGEWRPPTAPPKPAPVTLRRYGEAWLTERDLADRTRDHYRQLLRDHIFPSFDAMALAEITPAAVRTWHAALSKKTRAHR